MAGAAGGVEIGAAGAAVGGTARGTDDTDTGGTPIRPGGRGTAAACGTRGDGTAPGAPTPGEGRGTRPGGAGGRAAAAARRCTSS